MRTLWQATKREIIERLIIFGGNRAKTARSLGLSYRGLFNQIEKIREEDGDDVEIYLKGYISTPKPIGQDSDSPMIDYIEIHEEFDSMSAMIDETMPTNKERLFHLDNPELKPYREKSSDRAD